MFFHKRVPKNSLYWEPCCKNGDQPWRSVSDINLTTVFEFHGTPIKSFSSSIMRKGSMLPFTRPEVERYSLGIQKVVTKECAVGLETRRSASLGDGEKVRGCLFLTSKNVFPRFLCWERMRQPSYLTVGKTVVGGGGKGEAHRHLSQREKHGDEQTPY